MKRKEDLIDFVEKLKRTRIWKFIEIEKETDCWIWNGSKSIGAYGQVSWHGKSVAAHRLLYTLAIGEIEKGKILMHICEKAYCVNPLHLLPGTYQQNTCHMWGYPIGEVGKRPNPKSTIGIQNYGCKDIRKRNEEIKRMYREESVFQKDLCKMFRLSPSAISKIIAGQR